MSEIIVENSNKKPNQRAMGAIILIVLILIVCVVAAIKTFTTGSDNTVKVYGAVGGGKENLLADEEFNNILKEKEYGR